MRRSYRTVYLLIVFLLLIAGAPPAAAQDDTYAEAACRALSWLATQQGDDGSFGFTLATGVYQPSASTTADAVYVLALLGEDPAGSAWTRGGHSALAALAALAPGYAGTDAGQAGKVARAAALAGADPRSFAGMDLIATIEAAYEPSTGRYHPALLFRHTLAVEGLLRSGVTVPQAALDALLDAQLADGGWFWSFDGEQSDMDTTGRVLHLLAGQAHIADAPVYDRVAAFLAQLQTAEGGWGASKSMPPNSNSTALAVNGLRAAGFDLQAPEFQRGGRDPLTTLLSFQEESGAFVYIRQPGQEEVRLMATLDALMALAPLVSDGLQCHGPASQPPPAAEAEPGAGELPGPAGAEVAPGELPPSGKGVYLPMILVL